MQRSNKILKAVYSSLTGAAAMALGAAFIDVSSEWYISLKKPALAPPDIVFPIVWGILCILAAISLSMIIISPRAQKRTLYLYAGIGVLSVLWTYVFFQRHSPAPAFFLLMLIIVLAATLFAHAYRIDKTAAFVLIPVIVWLCFALYLNYEITFFN